MREFKLEPRYIVYKKTKLTDEQLEELKWHTQINDLPTTECLVLEPDWPEYQVALDAIKKRMENQ